MNNNSEEYNGILAKIKIIEDEIKELRKDIEKFDEDDHYEYEDEYEKEDMIEMFNRLKEEKIGHLYYKEFELEDLLREKMQIEFDNEEYE